MVHVALEGDLCVLLSVKSALHICFVIFNLFKAAQRVGFANCRCGCENHLIRVGKTLSYNVGQQNDPIMKKLSKTDAIALAAADKLERAERRRASRKKSVMAGLLRRDRNEVNQILTRE